MKLKLLMLLVPLSVMLYGCGEKKEDISYEISSIEVHHYDENGSEVDYSEIIRKGEEEVTDITPEQQESMQAERHHREGDEHTLYDENLMSPAAVDSANQIKDYLGAKSWEWVSVEEKDDCRVNEIKFDTGDVWYIFDIGVGTDAYASPTKDFQIPEEESAEHCHHNM